MIEIVFLDAGETLLGPHPSFAELFSEVCREHGRDIDPSDVREVQERLAPHLMDFSEETGVQNPSLSPDESRIFWTFLYRRFLEELGISDDVLATALYSVFSRASSYRLFDDVVPALRHLEASRYRLGVISNFEEWLAEMLMELEIGHMFDVTVISGVEGVEKPDPKIYEAALERAGVEADRAVHVGDSLGMDVEPAVSVGMRAVLLDRAGRYPQADVPKIETLEELPAVIAKL